MKAQCEWCLETYDDTNTPRTEDGKYGVCSEEHLQALLDNLRESREQ